ncbi:FHA domain-containing protein [Nakamurella sp. A5-74]|uniref:FHA domain-containing protein n=1 Tax=Nakamurella sp. A5-74 TaxID=3158264 RepID=A0AAU8DUC0_9ACTN
MSAVEYLPGERWLVSGPTAAIHLAGETAAALRWWPRIRDGVTARDLVAMLYDEGVLQSATPFAMIAVETDAVRVIVGGDTVVLVEDAAGHQISVTGADLMTWCERVVPDAAVVYVNCSTLPAAGELLPMPAGVVRADAVRWAVGADRADHRGGDRVGAGDIPPPAVPIDEDPFEHPRPEVILVGVPADVSGDAVLDHGVPDSNLDDVVGDDAITLIGVVPEAGVELDAPDRADAAVPQYIVPGQDPGGSAASGLDGSAELEQTVVTADPVDDAPEATPEAAPEAAAEVDVDADVDAAADAAVGVDIADEHQEAAEAEHELVEATEQVPDGADVPAALEDLHPLEETISHDEDAQDAAAEQDPPVVELPGEVTQTVPPEDLADRSDTEGDDAPPDARLDADADDDDADDADGADDDGADDDVDNDGAGHRDDADSSQEVPDGSDGSDGDRSAESLAGPAGAAGSDLLPVNPFPRMSLPPFVPPSAPGFVTSATPGAPTRAPFAPPPYPIAARSRDQDGPVGASTIRDVPRASAPPPFVPASTTLPPISAVPGQLAQIPPMPSRSVDPDAVATGVPPVPGPGNATAGDSDGSSIGADGGAAESRAGDHDGHTVLAESLPENHRPPAMPPEPGPGQVYASRCPAGHPNAPYAGDCRVCGTPIPSGDPVLVDRPTLAVLRMSSGAVIELDRRVIVGRAPSVSRVASADVPHLVTVASPHGDVSRSHVEVRVDDWHIVVTDLNSTNGTEIHAPARPVQMLRAGAGVVVEIGWQIDLGDGAGFLVDHL